MINQGTRRNLKLSFLGFLLLFASHSVGQIEVSSGIDFNYPLLVNANNARLNYGQVSFGLRAGIAYKPEETQFFPILNLSFGRTRLPLKQLGKNVAALNFNYLNVMLNENYIVHFSKSDLFIYGGVGFTYLMRKSGMTITGDGGESMKSSIDSTANVNKVFPAMNIGFEYNYGQSAGKPLYITMGINFQYTLLLKDRNSYFFTIADKGILTQYSADLSGNLINPGFYLAIHYLLHVGKKSSFYR